MTLTKDAVAERLSIRTGIAYRDAKVHLEMILDIVKQRLEAGEEVKISGFGKWLVKDKRARLGRNPQTGRPLEIDARRVVTFHPSEGFRRAVNNPVRTSKQA